MKLPEHVPSLPGVIAVVIKPSPFNGPLAYHSFCHPLSECLRQKGVQIKASGSKSEAGALHSKFKVEDLSAAVYALWDYLGVVELQSFSTLGWRLKTNRGELDQWHDFDPRKPFSAAANPSRWKRFSKWFKNRIWSRVQFWAQSARVFGYLSDSATTLALISLAVALVWHLHGSPALSTLSFIVAGGFAALAICTRSPLTRREMRKFYARNVALGRRAQAQYFRQFDEQVKNGSIE